MRKRTQARELALQLLYQVDLLRGDVTRKDQDAFLAEHTDDEDVRAYARTLVDGTLEHRAEADSHIEEVAKNWELSRMAIIDRNILRMGIFELIHRAFEVPPKVAINEAVDLAKKFSTKNSSAFVNGILDKIKERWAPSPSQPAAQPAESPEPPEPSGSPPQPSPPQQRQPEQPDAS